MLPAPAPSPDSTPSDAPLAPVLVDLIGQALEAAASPNTRRAYRADWACFTSWTAERDRCAMPATAQTVAAYLVQLDAEGKASSTLRRRLATISKAHGSQAPDAPNPATSRLVKTVLRGLGRLRGQGHGTPAAPVLPKHVRAMVKASPGDDLRACRDRALVLWLLASGMRRSEVSALTVADLDWTDPRGVVALVRRSKTDPTGEGRELSVHLGRRELTCPVRALRTWLDTAKIKEGPVFRGVDRHGHLGTRPVTGAGIAHAVKALAEKAGLDPVQVSPHGFRAGHVSARRAAGDDLAAVMDTTGHASVAMVQRYDRLSRRFRWDATASLGL